jgi:hypothetical protein
LPTLPGVAERGGVDDAIRCLTMDDLREHKKAALRALGEAA